MSGVPKGYDDRPPPYSPEPQVFPGYQTQPAAGTNNALPGYQTQPAAGTNNALPGYQTYPNPGQPMVGGYVPAYGSTAASVTIHPHEIIVIGACPACRIGVLEDDYTCLGIFLAIFFFPLGILCCLALKNRRCTNCGAYFG